MNAPLTEKPKAESDPFIAEMEAIRERLVAAKYETRVIFGTQDDRRAALDCEGAVQCVNNAIRARKLSLETRHV